MTEYQSEEKIISVNSDLDESDFQTLYRRFRPQKFSDLKGQDHVATALRNAVRSGRVAHAYLFSGPRGTGKTSTARILAKALNCSGPLDGEPCCACSSCTEIKKGVSLDVYELDAASNNGVDAMRELVSRAALGSPGRWKVYIIDEVHMLSTAASNALLKTLEEPPNHVIFVLATTDPQKILPTIRSRTQHFEFHLISNRNLKDLLDQVNETAGLGLKDNDLEVVLRKAKGSARDALSVLDLISVAGEVLDDEPQIELLLQTMIDQDSKQALSILEQLFDFGHDAQGIAQEIIEFLREGFIATVNPDKNSPAESKSILSKDMVSQLGLPLSVRAIELLGKTLVEMKDAPDPRITLEVGILRLTNPQLDDSYGALAERVRRLENKLSELTISNFKAIGSTDETTPLLKSPPMTKVTESLAKNSLEKVSNPDDNKDQGTVFDKTIGAYLSGSNANKEKVASDKEPEVKEILDKVELKEDKSVNESLLSINDGKDKIAKFWSDTLSSRLNPKDKAIMEGSFVVELNKGSVTIEVSHRTTLNAAEVSKKAVSQIFSQELGTHVEVKFIQGKIQAQENITKDENDEILPLEIVQTKIAELFPGATLEFEEEQDSE